MPKIVLSAEFGGKIKKCSTLNVEVAKDFVEFKCPACGKSRIVRSMKARKMGLEYTCPECGFVGP